MRVRVDALSIWAPDMSETTEWHQWMQGKRTIKVSKEAPDLKGFTDRLFRRRLSQISRMTIQVLHDTLQKMHDESTGLPLVFASLRGEVAREFDVSRMLVSERAVLPAAFSLSVFNAPVALATIALNLHGGYSAVYPTNGRIRDALVLAASMCHDNGSALFAYADEAVPEEYATLKEMQRYEPLAFAFVMCSNGSPMSNSTMCSKAIEEYDAVLDTDDIGANETPSEVLRMMIKEGRYEC